MVCVVFLDARSGARRFHATYEVRELHDHSLLSDVLGVHVIELPRLEEASGEGEGLELQRWARFLRFDDERALDSLASESPIMAEAKHALEILSREPSAQRIAEMREEAELMRRLDRAEDLAEGREQGLADGRRLGLLRSIEAVCRAFGIELDDERRTSLAALDEPALTAFLDSLCERRTWPL